VKKLPQTILYGWDREVSMGVEVMAVEAVFPGYYLYWSTRALKESDANLEKSSGEVDARAR
jgi:hypothetical protein